MGNTSDWFCDFGRLSGGIRHPLSGAYLLGWPVLWADPAVLAVAADLSGSGNTSEPAAVGNQMGL